MFSRRRNGAERELELGLQSVQALLGAAREHIADLIQDKKALQEQVLKLQEALVATTAPEIHREQRQALLDPKVQEVLDREHQVNELLARYASRIESEQLIQTHEDLEALCRVAGVPEPGPVAPNSES